MTTRQAGPPGARLVPGTVGDLSPHVDDWLLPVSGDRLGMPTTVTEPTADLLYVGEFDGRSAWAAESPAATLRWPELAQRLDRATLALAGRAQQLVAWKRTHRYCGACRAELGYEPPYPWPRCTECGLLVPMAPAPVVLVLIRRDDHVLLARHSYAHSDMWALVAGYVEYGETLEEAARREVWEEVGIEVEDLSYVDSQPWTLSGPGTLLVGFTAQWAAGEPTVDGVELTAAEWFPLAKLPDAVPPVYSLARWMLDEARA
ncbi:NAD(+) diphosphatase [Longispora sp. K20-0274]|uniref:NAD(+) diphosphatase n=1 Tax=Longispora sp. K20-0274 TaxID=3088255 RepID=UPI00399BCF67